MYPLRQRFIECMQARHLAVRTQQAYVRWMVELTRFYHRSPDELSDQELKAFLWSLSLQRHLSTSTCLQAFHALSFFYHEVLAHPFSEQLLPAMKRQQKIPDLLSPRDVAAILRACHQPKYFTVFTVCYGCGTRIGETLQLKVTDIDSELGLIHIRQGKGAKDRLVPLPKRVLAQLRDYWLRARPPTFLFSGHQSDQSLSISSVSKVYQRSKVAAGIVKQGGACFTTCLCDTPVSCGDAHYTVTTYSRSSASEHHLALYPLVTGLSGRPRRGL